MYILIPIYLLLVMSISYVGIKMWPVLWVYICCPASFGLGVWWTLCLIRERKGPLSKTISNIFCSVYIWAVWYQLVGAIDRYVSGRPLIVTETTSYLDILKWGVIGISLGFLLFMILRQIDHWEERRRMRRIIMKADAALAKSICGAQPAPHGVSE